MLAQAAGARMAITFVGTAVRWIAYRDPWCGIANVYVDGALVAQVDTYVNDYLKAVTMYTVTGLPAGQHTLLIEATGQKNSAAHASWIWVDAVDVVNSPLPPSQSALQIWSSFIPSFEGPYTVATFTPD